MYGSLFWIEWFDRLNRVLTSARHDVAILTRAVTPRTLQAIQRSQRQLSALTNDLRLLDPDVLAAGPTGSMPNAAHNLQKALEITVLQLGRLAELLPGSARPASDRMLAAIDSALRDSCYEVAMLLAPSRRHAIAAAPSARA